MKTITRFYKICFILSAAFLINANSLYSQSDPVIEAFSKSLKSETILDYTQAVKDIQEVYVADSYEMNLRLGWLYYKAANYNESMNYYQKAIDLMPYSIEAKLGYNLPASAADLWDKVIENYDKILLQDPQNTFVNYQLGNIYYYRQDFSKANSLFEKVVNLYPFGYDALLMFAWSNYQLGFYREAKILFNKVLMLSPGDASALEGLGLIK
ncbi:MAG: tetratricopeptide repeat protein [Ignavibacteria bacterium]|nr:tetratricopeptide repeat protein [Ignavibacteria bacterium]